MTASSRPRSNGAVFAAFPRTWMTAPPGTGADVTDVGAAYFVGAQTGEDQRQVLFGPVGAARGCAVAVHRLHERGHRGLGPRAGRVLAGLVRPTNGMELALRAGAASIARPSKLEESCALRER